MVVKGLDDIRFNENINCNKRKIVIVDDNEDHLMMMKFLFTFYNNRNEYLIFISAEKAIKYIFNIYNSNYKKIFSKSIDIDLIISDYNMYPLNGLEFYRELKENKVKIPFVLCSSFLSPQIIDEAHAIGVFDCVEKELNIHDTVKKFHVFLK
ncbi:MAG: response regulator [Candidatus Hodarchaeales archaeon]|jgi:CheY-like chemotaxis protein